MTDSTTQRIASASAIHHSRSWRRGAVRAAPAAVRAALGVVRARLGVVPARLGVAWLALGVVRARLGVVRARLGVVWLALGVVRAALGAACAGAVRQLRRATTAHAQASRIATALAGPAATAPWPAGEAKATHGVG